MFAALRVACHRRIGRLVQRGVDMSHLYGVLGIPRRADTAQVKAAYRALAKICHPDLPSGSDQRFKEISLAYATLGNPTRRAAYDASMRAQFCHRLKSAAVLMAASFGFTVGSAMFVAGLLLSV
jgi:curved DNA-binding protein CbpA